MLKRWTIQVIWALLFSFSSFAQVDPQPQEISEVGDDIGDAVLNAGTPLRSMHDYLRDSPQLHFMTAFRVSSPTSALRSQGTAEFFIRQPNSFRVEVSSTRRKTVYISDGATLTIYRPNERKFVQVSADDSILGTMYLATGLLRIQARMIDFFWTIDYLTIGYSEGKITPMGSEKIGKLECDRFKVQRFEDTWEVWLEKNGTPLPCKLISQRTDGTRLTSQVNEFTWMDNKAFDAETFAFSPPEGSKKVQLSDLK